MFNFKSNLQARRQSLRQNLQDRHQRKTFWRCGGKFLRIFLTRARASGPLTSEPCFCSASSKFRESVTDGKFVWIARINSGDERVHGAIQKFLVQPAQDKFSDAFFHAVAAWRNEWFAQRARILRGRKKVSSSKIPLATKASRPVFCCARRTRFGGRIGDRSGAIRDSDRGRVRKFSATFRGWCSGRPRRGNHFAATIG